MTEEIHMDEFFFFTYDSILKKLGRDDEGYAELEGEVEAVQKYMELKFDMQTYVEREHYFRGYKDCILFLIHCGALGIRH